jgi:hypothetical protein
MDVEALKGAMCGLLGAIRSLGDPAYQQRVWIEGRGPEVSSFDEIANQIFDDYGIDRILAMEPRQSGLTGDQRRALGRFRRVFGGSMAADPTRLA